MANNRPTLQQLSNSLTSIGLPTPAAQFLTPILHPESQTAHQRPLQVLTATAKHRLLSSDISNANVLSTSKNGCLPPNVSNVERKELILANDVCVQVLDVEDIGRSQWEQIEEMEMERKGEMVKGRQVIRVVADDLDVDSTQATTSSSKTSHGPFKLLLQDMNGNKVYGFELQKVPNIGLPSMGMSIGSKLMLRKGSKIARGVVLLEPKYVLVLGGKIEGMDKQWREGREAKLRATVGESRVGSGDGA
ncbi:hypothetical protein BP5796_07399 [Coleophoma crateriformis]|uniref:RecQ-mediated genome instability protein 1 n=1 Tax=Coleophoma crateriformis TaxID=565419 RepID=A0A3D8RIS9_9HELO|nr:hypothetical protein BP5796_07399 [Coleophoma crateriformis]